MAFPFIQRLARFSRCFCRTLRWPVLGAAVSLAVAIASALDPMRNVIPRSTWIEDPLLGNFRENTYLEVMIYEAIARTQVEVHRTRLIVADGWGGPWRSHLRDQSRLPTWAHPRIERDLGEERSAQLVIEAAGWPLRCVVSTTSYPSWPSMTPCFDRGGVRLQEPRWDRLRAGILPYWPWWPGLAANTLCYTAILGGAGALRRLLRSRTRRGRGQCVSCGYDREGITEEACPECGRPA